ncbi:hypothetical protein ACJIZ3_013307 [Penstemon smallii]|uniref:HEPN domain-containing protein n=1 Tax=Penstemon smallii TaxID=265156 RepID=A0ABD3UT05_9LAMI
MHGTDEDHYETTREAEKMNVSSEALETARIACNKYMSKYAGKDAFHNCEMYIANGLRKLKLGMGNE